MRFFLILFICLFSSGCATFWGSKQADPLAQEGIVEKTIAVGVQKLWQAAVIEFRNTEIIEANREEFSIRGIKDKVIIEFKARPEDEKRSVFRVKAAGPDQGPELKAAQRFANLIYKRAKSIWFSLIHSRTVD
ncbi:MAG: hypothetical protein JW734_09680 [Candidatus Omnitrophica bacterium]|nr:hypothetical protein [Candidatus Omnitrophota bacterium]